mmetsp:Transcript_17206/g.44080  ORF Transcript_17206/g.44080 Transcript_17206/m.44080 type:complete len:254 (-) Transcript_17206:244-1005(-)
MASRLAYDSHVQRWWQQVAIRISSTPRAPRPSAFVPQLAIAAPISRSVSAGLARGACSRQRVSARREISVAAPHKCFATAQRRRGCPHANSGTFNKSRCRISVRRRRTFAPSPSRRLSDFLRGTIRSTSTNEGAALSAPVGAGAPSPSAGQCRSGHVCAHMPSETTAFPAPNSMKMAAVPARVAVVRRREAIAATCVACLAELESAGPSIDASGSSTGGRSSLARSDACAAWMRSSSTSAAAGAVTSWDPLHT